MSKFCTKCYKVGESFCTKPVHPKCPFTTFSIKTMLRCWNQDSTAYLQGDASVTAWSENHGKQNNYESEQFSH